MKMNNHPLYLIGILVVLSSTHMYFTNAGVNRIFFEKVQCSTPSKSGITINKCLVKLTSRDNICVDAAVTTNRTIRSGFIHYTVFYQFSTNEYRQLGLNAWEDFCGYMNGDKKNLVIAALFPSVVNYTNVNHTCPYEPGLYFGKHNNLTESSMSLDFLVPSGRYRIEINVHEGFKGMEEMGITTKYTVPTVPNYLIVWITTNWEVREIVMQKFVK